MFVQKTMTFILKNIFKNSCRKLNWAFLQKDWRKKQKKTFSYDELIIIMPFLGEIIKPVWFSRA